MLTLYPEIIPFNTHMLAREPLSDGRQHEIYIEQCGNPQGLPVVFLHGGPGSGCAPHHRQFFNPARYHIILFDQRGCGRSLPTGLLEHNDTRFLVDDMEAIRDFLGIDRWVVFGGSWGATLALCYARSHPERVISMILRGCFLGRQQDIDWVYAAGGASKVFADAWQRLIANVPADQQTRPLAHFYQKLQSTSAAERRDAATTLQHWEANIVKMRDTHYEPDTDDAAPNYAHALIQLHYALHHCFLDDTPLLFSLAPLKQIPIKLIHGRYDMVCPVEQSWLLQQALPHAELTLVPLAGHAANEPGLVDALIRATDAVVNTQS